MNASTKRIVYWLLSYFESIVLYISGYALEFMLSFRPQSPVRSIDRLIHVIQFISAASPATLASTGTFKLAAAFNLVCFDEIDVLRAH